MLRSLFLLLGLCLIPLVHWGQENVSPKAQKARQEAREWIKKGKPDKALAALDKAILLSPDYYAAISDRAALLLESEPATAEADLRRLVLLRPEEDPSVWLALARICRDGRRWEEAVAAYDRYLHLAPDTHHAKAEARRERNNSAFAGEARRTPVPFAPIPLPATINRPGQMQYGAVFRGDGRYMVFTRRVDGQEDFYAAQRTGPDWSVAEPIHELNSLQNEGMHSLGRDGSILVFTRCQDSRGLGSCDLYISSLGTDGRWSAPRNMGPGVNTRHWDAQPALSADGSMLIYSSTRPGGKGESDLWWTFRDSAGDWSEPQPIPGAVNTPFREQTPFLHADGKTLYFSSDGHPGMGDMDLFVTRFQPGIGWSDPVNLGYPVNTEGHEGSLSLYLDGHTACLATDRNLADDWPRGIYLYEFILAEEVRGIPVTYVRGRVTDASTGRGLPGRFLVRQQGPDQESAYEVSARENGEFLVCLPSGSEYAVILELPGYAFYSSRFSIREENAFQPYELDIALHRLATVRDTGQEVRIVLRNILFPTGSDVFHPSSLFELERVKALMEENPEIRVRLEGHTDNTGLPVDNQALSSRRADAVRNWLVRQGIAGHRIQSAGYGDTRPVADNTTSEGKQLNRRTEMVILR